MKDLDVSTDPADYMYGPTGNTASRGNGGTNRSGGVSVVEVSDDIRTTRTAPVDQQGESQPAPAPAAEGSTQQQQQSTESGSR